jgi:GDP-mannose 6-dehydrogenase
MTTTVSVFGLGYVGCVSAACFAKQGHNVIGVDVNPAKVGMINSGQATIVESGIAELVAEMVRAKRLRATCDAAEAVRASSISLICVGTPSRANGSIELAHVERVCEQIGAAIGEKDERHTVVVRSTVLPGTTDDVVIPILERMSGKRAERDFGVCMNPEFLREGSSIKDFYAPPYTLIGSDDPQAHEAAAALYAGIGAPMHKTATRVAEMIKYACNCFHGLKVAFANEIGSVCKALDVDSHDVMRLFCEDTKLNISPAYLRPGFAFGGSCLPKDLRAVTHRARQLDVDTPVLRATLESNEQQIQRAYDMVRATGRKRVGVLGLSFKAGTDDLRESPIVALVERLIGKGMEVSIYDRHVSSAAIMGANRDYIEREIPHVWSLMKQSVRDVIDACDTVVIGNAAPEFREIRPLLRPDQSVIDLVRAFGSRTSDGATYQGIAW